MYLAGLLLAAALQPSPPVPALSPAPLIAQQVRPNVAGQWDTRTTGDGDRAYRVRLIQEQGSVSGTYSGAQGDRGTLDGRLVGTEFRGQWRGGNGSGGWVRLSFSGDGTSFEGTWGYAGREISGEWIGSRL